MAYNLPYSLSAEDAAFFATLAETSVLPETTTPSVGEFALRVFQDRKEKERALLGPYADLLEAEVRRQIMALKPEDMLAELRACPVSNMRIKLFSWNTVFFQETLTELQARVAGMDVEQRSQHRDAVWARDYEMEQSGACHTLGLMGSDYNDYNDYDDNEYPILKPVKVHRIFMKTNLAERLTLLFGPNFVPCFGYEELPELSRSGDLGYAVTKVTLYARYYPEGLPKTKLLALLKTARTEKIRREEYRIHTLASSEWLVGIGEWRTGSRNTMVTPPRRVSLLGAPCHCSHHDDDSE